MADEYLSDEALVNKVLETLRILFSEKKVLEPLASKVTKWGGDEFSRGSYTFLPPGTSDQDFQILQSPINGNGDSLVLDGSETMRFVLGRRTHHFIISFDGSWCDASGIRAAKEAESTTKFGHIEGQTAIDKLIPLAIFRKRNPGMPLQCSLCNLYWQQSTRGFSSCVSTRVKASSGTQ